MNPFTVTEKAMRPASPERRCFYCRTPVGGEHKEDCVLIRKKVRLRFTVEYETDVPAYEDGGLIEFYYNESSSCMDKRLAEIAKYAAEHGARGCLCGLGKIEYIGKVATPAFLEE